MTTSQKITLGFMLAAFVVLLPTIAMASDSGPQPTVWDELLSIVGMLRAELSLQQESDLYDGIEQAKEGSAVSGMVLTDISAISAVVIEVDCFKVPPDSTAIVKEIQAAALEGIVEKDKAAISGPLYITKPDATVDGSGIVITYGNESQE